MTPCPPAATPVRPTLGASTPSASETSTPPSGSLPPVARAGGRSTRAASSTSSLRRYTRRRASIGLRPEMAARTKVLLVIGFFVSLDLALWGARQMGWQGL